MKHLPSKSLLLVLAIVANLLVPACGGGSSAGGDGGASSSSSGSGDGGAGGTSGAGGQAAGGGGQGGSAHCFGDAAAWAPMTQAPMACQMNSDCCVVINDCLAEAQVVRAKDYAAAPSTWPYCDDLCTNCIAPVIEVGCENGACVGKVKENGLPGDPLSGSHCGVDPVVAPAQDLHFGCGM